MRAQRFREIALPHLNAAYNLARWLTHNDQDAQDIVQEAYLRAFKFFDGFRGDDARAWLLAIVRNTAYTWLQQNRDHAAHVFYDEAFEDLNATESATLCDQPDSNPVAILTQIDDKHLLDQALIQLPVEFREILVLRELENLSYKEISQIACIPIGTVMSRLARGRKLLRACLEQMN
ncbi:MAG: sigma-70 family RNA polymerase sigma factor [Sulfuriferula sp.]|nr:sigma-70 family RNA polymerase sigma factor [Sulfuriferula sp.]